jgi:hypothetical protein
MKLSFLLKLQLLYMLMGIGYNGISLLMASAGNKPLSSTSATQGVIVLLVYGLFLLSGYLGYQKLYRLFMAIAFIGLGYGGVISHLLNYTNLNLYYSPVAWFLAIAINLTGMYLNFIALAGRFTVGAPLHT